MWRYEGSHNPYTPRPDVPLLRTTTERSERSEQACPAQKRNSSVGLPAARSDASCRAPEVG